MKSTIRLLVFIGCLFANDVLGMEKQNLRTIRECKTCLEDANQKYNAKKLNKMIAMLKTHMQEKLSPKTLNKLLIFLAQQINTLRTDDAVEDAAEPVGDPFDDDKSDTSSDDDGAAWGDSTGEGKAFVCLFLITCLVVYWVVQAIMSSMHNNSEKSLALRRQEYIPQAVDHMSDLMGDIMDNIRNQDYQVDANARSVLRSLAETNQVIRSFVGVQSFM